MSAQKVDVPPYLPSYLTAEQRDAILHTGSPLLIIAGPGSGKTEVITWRVSHLVQADLVSPERMLVTTFTNKAALELKDRIQQKLSNVDVMVRVRLSSTLDYVAALRHMNPYPLGGNAVFQLSKGNSIEGYS